MSVQTLMRSLLVVLFTLLYYTGSVGQSSSFKQTGLASYYGKKFHGQKTASGEIFDMHSFTAAHKKLPFNTFVKVTNIKTKKSIVVRINDRGPYGHNRIIDLSRAGAEKLGMIKKGMIKVKIEVVDPAKEKKIETIDPVEKAQIQKLRKFEPGITYTMEGRKIKPRGYGIEIARSSNIKEAAAFLLNYTETTEERVYIKVFKKGKEKTYRLVSGNFTEYFSAEKHATKLKSKGYNVQVRQN